MGGAEPSLSITIIVPHRVVMNIVVSLLLDQGETFTVEPSSSQPAV